MKHLNIPTFPDPIPCNPETGNVSLSRICAHGELDLYLQSSSTQEFLHALASQLHLPVRDIAHCDVYEDPDTGEIIKGVWGHPFVAMDLARWVSVDFRIWSVRALTAHE